MSIVHEIRCQIRKKPESVIWFSELNEQGDYYGLSKLPENE